MTREELDGIKILSLEDDGEWGYTFDVNLHYRKEHHDHHADLPLAIERIQITEDMLSDYQKEQPHLKSTAKKLVPTFFNKEHYIIHYRLLKYFFLKGINITKINTGIKYRQKAWLQPYVEYNTEKRKQARTKFASDLCKAFVNSLFGKTMEAVRKRRQVKVVREQKASEK